MTRDFRWLALLAACAVAPGAGCNCGSESNTSDAGTVADASGDAGGLDAGAGTDAGSIDGGPDGGLDAGGLDAGSDAAVDGGADAGSADGGPTYSCRGFATPSGWTPAAGFRAVEAFTGLSQPVALGFAGGAYGAGLYIVNQGDNTISRADLATGAVELFATLADPVGSHLLTTITWDSGGDFDGALYVGDQGTDGDQDSVIYRLSPEGALTAFARAPVAGAVMPGLDDIYGLSFTPGARAGWPTGLLVTGDTDGTATLAEWGLYDAQGHGTAFSSLAGTQGLCVDTSGRYGGGMLASRPAGGGFSGDDTITKVLADGTSGGAVVSGLPGVHAVVVAPAGPFGQNLYAASWSSGRLLSVDPDGTTHDLATGLSLTNYDGNILAFSPDGKVLLVADRSQNRVVCIEPVE